MFSVYFTFIIYPYNSKSVTGTVKIIIIHFTSGKDKTTTVGTSESIIPTNPTLDPTQHTLDPGPNPTQTEAPVTQSGRIDAPIGTFPVLLVFLFNNVIF